MNENFCEVCLCKLNLTLTPNTIHYGRLDCPRCGFKGFARNPNNPRSKGTSRYRTGNKVTVEKIMEWHGFLGKPFCFMCLREEKDLGIREALTADHIQELRQTEEGQDRDVVRNGQVLCSACHKMKLWLTTYLKDHIKGKMEDENDTTPTKTIRD